MRGSFNIGLALAGTLAIAALTALLLLLGGRLSYWQAWLFAGVNETIVLIMALRFGPEMRIMRERMRFGSASIWWDRLFLALFMPMNLIVIVLAGLDAGRLQIGPAPSLFLYIPCYMAYLGAAYLHLSAVRSNTHYVPTVYVKEGQRVADRGPYRYIRHPGYTGIIVMMLAVAVLLGSFVALIPAAIIMILVICRTTLEDRMLLNELQGYTEYAKRVRYRLVPWIW